jgi:hypothetical protein
MAIERAELSEEVEDSSDTSETSHIPVSLLAGKSVNPGDVVRLEVVNVDQDGGFVEVKYAKSGEKKSSAIEEASMAFNPSKNMEAM